jgi:ATP/maltotriose-dependent transcriptional regulator MalT
VRAKALRAAAELARRQAAFAQAETFLHDALSVCRTVDDREGLARTLNNLGNLAATQGHYAQAQQAYEESQVLLRGLGNRQLLSIALGNLANVRRSQGDTDVARELHEEALTLARALADLSRVAHHLTNLGALWLMQGDAAKAEACLRESLTLRQQLGDPAGEATVLRELAIVAYGCGDWSRTLDLCRRSLRMLHEVGATPDIPRCLVVLATVLAVSGNADRAARLWGAAEELERASGAVSEVHLDYQHELGAARAQLGEHVFGAAWAAGRAMSLNQVTDLALADDQTPSAGPDSLTSREREVAALLARGYSNRQIAEALVIGERTVETHVGNVLAKLGLASRHLVGAWAAAHRLVRAGRPGG